MFEGFHFHPIIVNDFLCFLICNCCVHHKDNEFPFLYSFLATKKINLVLFKTMFVLSHLLISYGLLFNTKCYKHDLKVFNFDAFHMVMKRPTMFQIFLYIYLLFFRNLISQLNILLYQHSPK
jgi:hypothetical protein